MIDVSVITASLPERWEMLQECRESVAAQCGCRVEHLVIVDERREGFARTVNRIAHWAAGEWLWILGDDDLLHDSRCLVEHLLVAGDADIVYSVPLVTPAWYCPGCGRRYTSNGICHNDHPPLALRPTGVEISSLTPPVLPASSLIRRTLWERLGGYDSEWTRGEDQEFYIRALNMGAVFAPGVPGLWTVRRHDGCKTNRPLTEREREQWAQAGVT